MGLTDWLSIMPALVRALARRAFVVQPVGLHLCFATFRLFSIGENSDKRFAKVENHEATYAMHSRFAEGKKLRLEFLANYVCVSCPGLFSGSESMV